MSIRTDLFALLRDNVSLVEGRVFGGGVMWQGVAHPATCYVVTATVFANDLAGDVGGKDRATVELHHYGDTYESAQAVAAQARVAMLAAAFKNTLQNEFDLYDPDVKLYRIVQQYNVWST